jgi:hypothetical protein
MVAARCRRKPAPRRTSAQVETIYLPEHKIKTLQMIAI